MLKSWIKEYYSVTCSLFSHSLTFSLLSKSSEILLVILKTSVHKVLEFKCFVICFLIMFTTTKHFESKRVLFAHISSVNVKVESMSTHCLNISHSSGVNIKDSIRSTGHNRKWDALCFSKIYQTYHRLNSMELCLLVLISSGFEFQLVYYWL